VRLADAFLHGRLDIEHPPDYLELACYDSTGAACQGSEAGCHGYVIEPPMPAVVLTPFVAIFGADLNQVLVSIAIGAAAIGLFWVAARRMGWDYRLSAAITVLLALGTDFWWASGDGSLWQFSQVCAVFFMMAALVEATGRKRVVLVGLLLGLAGLCRLPTFLAFPFFLYLTLRGRTDLGTWRQIMPKVALFGLGLGSMALMVVLYNYARFGTVADLGYVHPQYEGGISRRAASASAMSHAISTRSSIKGSIWTRVDFHSSSHQCTEQHSSSFHRRFYTHSAPGWAGSRLPQSWRWGW
jgi:hypothetical protein